MKETPQEYIKRIVGRVEGKKPLSVQAATPKKLDRLVSGVPIAKLRKRPAPAQWSANEILAHLADTEIAVGFRLRMILGTPGTPIAAFDQDAWGVSGRYNQRDPRKSLEQFRVLREANLRLLKSLEPGQWEHYGMHAERGRETIEQVVRLLAGHDLNHIEQIECVLGRRVTGR